MFEKYHDRMKTKQFAAMVAASPTIKPHPRPLAKRVRDEAFYDRRWADRLQAISGR
jgi:hypothetical protein